MPFSLKCFKLKRKRKVKRKLSSYYLQTYKDTLSEMGEECLRIYATPDTLSSIGDEHEYPTAQTLAAVKSVCVEDIATTVTTNESNSSPNTAINENLLNNVEIPSETNGSEEGNGDITTFDGSSVVESINENLDNNSVIGLEEEAAQYSALIDESTTESRLPTKRLMEIILNDTINGHSNRKSIDAVECNEGVRNPQEEHLFFRQNTCSDENVLNENFKEKKNGDETLSPNIDCSSSISSGVSLSELLQSIFETDNEMSALSLAASDILAKSSNGCDRQSFIENQKEMPENASPLLSSEDLSKTCPFLYTNRGLLSKEFTLLDASGKLRKHSSYLDVPEILSNNAFFSDGPTALTKGSSSDVSIGLLKNYVLPEAPGELWLPSNLAFGASGDLVMPKNSSSDSEENAHHGSRNTSDTVETVHRVPESASYRLEEIPATETKIKNNFKNIFQYLETDHDLSQRPDIRCRISSECIPDFQNYQNQSQTGDTFSSLPSITRPVESSSSSSTKNVKEVVPETAIFGYEITNCSTKTETKRELERTLSCRIETSATEESEISNVETFSNPEFNHGYNFPNQQAYLSDVLKVHNIMWKSQAENEKRSIQTTKTKSRGALTSRSSSMGSIYSDGGDGNEPLKKNTDEMTAYKISEKGEGCLKPARNTTNSCLSESFQMQKTTDERQEYKQIVPSSRTREIKSDSHVAKSLIILKTPKKGINAINGKSEEKTTQTISLKLLSYNRTENIEIPSQLNQKTNRSPAFDLQSVEATHEAYISIFNRYKSEATSCFDTNTRLIPIQSAKSYEFTVSSYGDPSHIDVSSLEILSNGKEMEKLDKCGICLPPSHQDTLTEPNPTMEITFKSKSKETTSIQSLVKDNSNRDQSKNEYSCNQSIDSRSRKGVDQTCQSLNLTPRRKKILSTSKDIRSPKYPVKLYTRSPAMRFQRNPRFPSKFPAVAMLLKDNETGRYRFTKNRIHLKAGRHDDIIRTGSIISVSDPPPSHRAFSPKELRVKFDETFRRYASKGRMTGDLMSSRRSTEWLKDAGIIGDLLTTEEAKNIFRCAAGVKIALNKCEYRHFVYKLSRLKAISYNQIYERLCNVSEGSSQGKI